MCSQNRRAWEVGKLAIAPRMAVSPTLSSPLAVPTNKGRQPPSELDRAMQSLDDHTAMKAKSPEDRQAFYNSLISLCISHRALPEANRLRYHIVRSGLQPSLFLDNQFINLYARCGDPGAARDVFDSMHYRNVVSWNAVMSGYCSNYQFLDAIALFSDMMMENGVNPDDPTYLSVIRASAGSRNVRHGQQVHALLIKEGGLDGRTRISNALIGMYSKIGWPDDAEDVFKGMLERDAVSWNSLIAAGGSPLARVALFIDMQNEGLLPDEFTFGSLLASEEVALIEELHSHIVKRGLGSNVFTASALSDAYARSGDLQSSLRVFDEMSDRNTVTWNSVIAACFENGATREGLRLFLEMTENGMVPDEYTISILLKAAVCQLSSAAGKQFHGIAIKMGWHRDTLMGNTIITMYGENDAADNSWGAFQDIAEPDLITWNSLVQSYVRNERFEQALDLFVKARCLGFQSDAFSYVAALAACSSLTWLRTGRGVHCHLIKATGLEPDAFVGCALIDMYAKSTAIEDAEKVFYQIKRKDLITWNSTISGLAQNGDLHGLLDLLRLMREENLQPDNFTFASILSASSDAIASATQLGSQVHALIWKSECNPDTAVGNALLTMYIKAGSIKEAEQVFSEIIDRNVVSWTAMIGGYAQSGYSMEALELFDEMERSRVMPNGKTFVALLTACSYAGLREEGEKYFEMMRTRYGINPDFNHYACRVDILGRAGRLSEAEALIEVMPYEPDALVWRMLLSACTIHGDLVRGERAMERILVLEPDDSAAYVLASNLNAAAGNWKAVEEIRQLMRKDGVKKEPAKSWIEVHNIVHEFMAGDYMHPQKNEICARLGELFTQMKDDRYPLPTESQGEIIVRSD